MFSLPYNSVCLDRSQPNRGLDLAWYYVREINKTTRLGQSCSLSAVQRLWTETKHLQHPNSSEAAALFIRTREMACSCCSRHEYQSHTAQEGLHQCADKMLWFYFTQIVTIWPTFRSLSAAVVSIFCRATSPVLAQQSTPAWWIRACQGLTITWMPPGAIRWNININHTAHCFFFFFAGEHCCP